MPRSVPDHGRSRRPGRRAGGAARTPARSVRGLCHRPPPPLGSRGRPGPAGTGLPCGRMAVRSSDAASPAGPDEGRVADLLREVAETHHRVYRKTDGADPDWPIWYAGWLVDLSELPEVL